MTQYTCPKCNKFTKSRKWNVDRHAEKCTGFIPTEIETEQQELIRLRTELQELKHKVEVFCHRTGRLSLDGNDPGNPSHNSRHPIHIAGEAAWEEMLIALGKMQKITYDKREWVYDPDIDKEETDEIRRKHQQRCKFEKGEWEREYEIEVKRYEVLLDHIIDYLWYKYAKQDIVHRKLKMEKLILWSIPIVKELYPECHTSLIRLTTQYDIDSMKIQLSNGTRVYKPEHSRFEETVEYLIYANKKIIIDKCIERYKPLF
jgi:hypothetical protein